MKSHIGRLEISDKGVDMVINQDTMFPETSDSRQSAEIGQQVQLIQALLAVRDFMESKNPFFEEIATDFFGEKYVANKEKKNEYHSKTFYRNRRGYLKNYILPYFAGYKIREIDTDLCEKFSMSLPNIAPDTKNNILFALKEIFKPLVRKRIISYNPVTEVDTFSRIDKERDVFTKPELKKLYPKDIDDALKIWGSPLALAWGLVLIDTGCRPSEAIAWTWEDFNEKWGGFPIVKRIIDGQVILGTKSGSKKFRVAVLSEMALQVIKLLRETKKVKPTDRVFPFLTPQGRIYVRKAIERAGIPLNGRTQYCLRHTAVTQTINISKEFALNAFGHSPSVQEGYDHPSIDELFMRLPGAREILRKRLDEIE